MFFLPSKGHEILLTIVTVWNIASKVNQPDVRAEAALATSPRTSSTKTRSPSNLPTASVLSGKKSDEQKGRYWDKLFPGN